jgi:hypothetical protein
MRLSSRRPSAERFAERWQADDLPTDVFDMAQLKSAANSRARVLRKLPGYTDSLARRFAEETAHHGIQVAVMALTEASLNEEASILLKHDLAELAENSGALSERIFAPAEAAAREADAANARAEAAHSVANARLNRPDLSPEDVLEDIQPGGIGEHALSSGFEASLAQQQAFAIGGAALAGRSAIMGTKMLVAPVSVGDAAAAGVLTACVCGHQAGSANYQGPPMQVPNEDPQIVWRRASLKELVRQTDFILGEMAL